MRSTESRCERRALGAGGRQSLKLLLTHLGVCAAAALAALVWYDWGFRFPPCAVHSLTGLWCLTCGATRAAYELAHLRVWRSLTLNPLPIMLALWLAASMALELAGVIQNRRIKQRRWLAALIVMLAVNIVYCVLRNLGAVPSPEQIFP